MFEGNLVRLATVFIVIVIIVAIIFAVIIKPDAENPAALVTFSAQDGDVTFNCEVADTDSERAIGLMNRETLDQNAGMLFEFEYPQNVSFWMKNTLIPLDIVFIDSTGKVVNIEQADPQPGVVDDDLLLYSSARPVKWVLEINQGLCDENSIVPGTEIEIA